jgi:hypothetical protein
MRLAVRGKATTERFVQISRRNNSLHILETLQVLIERGDASAVLGCRSCKVSIAEVHVRPDNPLESVKHTKSVIDVNDLGLD